MMQHCQQVFAEVSQGGMSIGAGGMPKTMIAGGPPPGMQQPGMQQPGMQQPGMSQPGMHAGMSQPGMSQPGMSQPGMPHGGLAQQQPMQSSAGAKTMIAQPSPFAQGQMPPGMPPGQMPPGMQGQMPPGMPQQGPAQPGFIQASAGQKTIVAGMAPPIVNGQLMQPGQNPYGNPMQTGYPSMPGTQPSPNKTVMLQPSEGVISVARTGQAVQPAGGGATQQGASTLFWIVSLVIGVAVGALGYVIVLQL
jgi:hypothetical protein